MAIAKTGCRLMLFFSAILMMPLIVFAQDPGQAGEATAQLLMDDECECPKVDENLKPAPGRSEPEMADLEKKYREMSEKERHAREQVEKLTAEKEALLKGCPPKTAEKAPDSRVVAPGRKKKAGSHLKPSRKNSVEKVASESKEKVKHGKNNTKRGPKVKRAAVVKGAVPLTARKSCGARISLSEVKKVLQKERTLAGKNLNGLNLAGMDLSSVNLSGACLVGSDLDRANLQEANLERADVTGANLRMASLRLANVNDIILDGAVLDGAIWADSRTCLSGSVGRCRDIIH